jgi:hypothetical protein
MRTDRLWSVGVSALTHGMNENEACRYFSKRKHNSARGKPCPRTSAPTRGEILYSMSEYSKACALLSIAEKTQGRPTTALRAFDRAGGCYLEAQRPEGVLVVDRLPQVGAGQVGLAQVRGM